ncbi:MAG: TonB-dependent receptor, partial [Ignavibacteriales bacterium]|nr:TonB-dependent receptor [Ignavibacteriales bacterium]
MKLVANGFIFLSLVILLFSTSVLAQGTTTATISGIVTDKSGQGLPGANVVAMHVPSGATYGAHSREDGSYNLPSVRAGGPYTVTASYIGYQKQEKRNVTLPASESVRMDFQLTEEAIQAGEVIVEVNRAKERQTPVAFTDVGKEQIDERIHGQDAPLLLKGTPGLYAFSTDGVGNGESKLFVRGFNQNYVQVLINGVPTNDPESNSVYWSNWGSVSSAAASVQVQRGAGSSLYGAGSFGGSFNIVTGSPRPRAFYGVNLNLGSPQNTLYGVELGSGLIDNTYALSFKLDRKLGEGNRLGGRYEGYNYYLSGSWYINNQQSLNLVLHGAPQEHGYSFSNDISYFKYFDYKANSAPWLWTDAVNKLPSSASGKANYGLTDGIRELMAPNYVTLAHNHFHKPQIELHYNHALGDESAIRATFFFSRGRGGGSSLNSAGTPSNVQRDPDGSIRDTAVIRNVYLRTVTTATNNAYQRDSYSLHQQGGILANYETRLNEDLKVTLGGEFRSWTADHPGHFTN